MHFTPSSVVHSLEFEVISFLPLSDNKDEAVVSGRLVVKVLFVWGVNEFKGHSSSYITDFLKDSWFDLNVVGTSTIPGGLI